jgi:hypothetical protein
VLGRRLPEPGPLRGQRLPQGVVLRKPVERLLGDLGRKAGRPGALVVGAVEILVCSL